jgi:ferredoxin
MDIPESPDRYIARVRQTDCVQIGRISCTGSGTCNLIAPDVIGFPNERGLCFVVDGADLEGDDSAVYSAGGLPVDKFDIVADAVRNCDSEALEILELDTGFAEVTD